MKSFFLLKRVVVTIYCSIDIYFSVCPSYLANCFSFNLLVCCLTCQLLCYHGQFVLGMLFILFVRIKNITTAQRVDEFVLHFYARPPSSFCLCTPLCIMVLILDKKHVAHA